MKIRIEAWSKGQAFEYLQEACESDGIDYPGNKTYIDLDNNNQLSELGDEVFENLGLLFCYTMSERGENKNVRKTQVEYNVHKGAKEWDTKYGIVYDSPKSLEIVKPMFDTKKAAVDAARELCENTGRSTYVILGKSPRNFQRLEASISYKGSEKQELSKFIFLW
jgi:hypothetical protein